MTSSPLVGSPRPAAFLDRDNTIVHDPGFLRSPDLVTLLPGVADALGGLNAAGIPVVVVTNQSGIARGLITPDQYRAVNARMASLLEERGARVDGVYYCPHHPDITGPCECRKPGPLLYRTAAVDLNLDLERSWFVGDRLTDVVPARGFGGRGILITSPGSPAEEARRHGYRTAEDLTGAATLILADWEAGT